jgi:hypothetical protein
LRELRPHRQTLEELFIRITGGEDRFAAADVVFADHNVPGKPI